MFINNPGHISKIEAKFTHGTWSRVYLIGEILIMSLEGKMG